MQISAIESPSSEVRFPQSCYYNPIPVGTNPYLLDLLADGVVVVSATAAVPVKMWGASSLCRLRGSLI